jgi:hypothetical protein
MALPYRKTPFKKRPPYLAPRNPSGKSAPRFVKLKLTSAKETEKKRFFGG